uniref:RING-type domain-containing protein n=1 Tax=Odontella aurita TaxID=265563 RepID=A0A7S4JBN7_9STRA|mmetsp:Transcript_43230/g.131602  ORF Transcript_43230/g.131602 Transcript_43230/m.131602 type:complete len:288 (+) Transcript_43230:52-915(+)
MPKRNIARCTSLSPPQKNSTEMAKECLLVMGIIVGVIFVLFLLTTFVQYICELCRRGSPSTTHASEGGGVLAKATKSERSAVLESLIIGKTYKKPLLLQTERRQECMAGAISNGSSCLPANCPEDAAAGGMKSPIDTEEVDIERQSPSHDDKESDQNKADTGDCISCAQESYSQCVICIHDYVEGDEVTVGSTCSHMFHRTCLLDWLRTTQAFCCPYCRGDFVTPVQIRETAERVLGNERVVNLIERRKMQGGNAMPPSSVGHMPPIVEETDSIDQTVGSFDEIFVD